MSLTVRLETFESLRNDWQTLLTEIPDTFPFLTPTWLETWWQSLGQGNELALYSMREAGRLRGIAPMMRSGRTLRFLAASDVCDYHDFLFAPGCEQACLDSFLDTLAEAPWDSLQLEGIREHSQTLERLPVQVEKRGWQISRSPDEVSPLILVFKTWDEYLESLDKKDRHELRRKFRRLEGAGQVRLIAIEGGPGLDADVGVFLKLMAASRESKEAFLTPERERFFHTLAKAMGGAGYLKVFFLELDGLRVATAYCFDYCGGYYLYNSGFDPAHASLSVGLLLKALCLRDAIEKGKTKFDLLRGAEPYKYHLGAKDQWVHKLAVWRAD